MLVKHYILLVSLMIFFFFVCHRDVRILIISFFVSRGEKATEIPTLLNVLLGLIPVEVDSASLSFTGLPTKERVVDQEKSM